MTTPAESGLRPTVHAVVYSDLTADFDQDDWLDAALACVDQGLVGPRAVATYDRIEALLRDHRDPVKVYQRAVADAATALDAAGRTANAAAIREASEDQMDGLVRSIRDELKTLLRDATGPKGIAILAAEKAVTNLWAAL